MTPNSRQKKDSSYFATVAELAKFCGVTDQGIRKSYLPFLDDDSIRKGKPMRYRARDVLNLMIERRASSISADAMLDDFASPALERWRSHRADLASLDLAERRNELIDRSKNRDTLARWASLVRRMGEQLGRRYGNDASELVNRTLEECGRVVQALGDESDD